MVEASCRRDLPPPPACTGVGHGGSPHNGTAGRQRPAPEALVRAGYCHNVGAIRSMLTTSRRSNSSTSPMQSNRRSGASGWQPNTSRSVQPERIASPAQRPRKAPVASMMRSQRAGRTRGRRHGAERGVTFCPGTRHFGAVLNDGGALCRISRIGRVDLGDAILMIADNWRGNWFWHGGSSRFRRGSPPGRRLRDRGRHRKPQVGSLGRLRKPASMFSMTYGEPAEASEAIRPIL